MTRVIPNKVDRDSLHAYLFRKANSRGKLVVRHLDLAESLGIRSDHLGRIMREMADDNRLSKITQSGRDGVIYVIKDPASWVRPAPTRKTRR